MKVEETDDCTICFSELGKEEIKGSYFCSNHHIFHSECAWNWLKTKLDGYNAAVDNKQWKCPLCNHIPTSPEMLYCLIDENLWSDEELLPYYLNKLNEAYPTPLLTKLWNDFTLTNTLEITGKLLLFTLVATITISAVVACIAYKVYLVAHKTLAHTLDMDEQKLAIIEFNLAILALIILSI